jgi:hypothetical protein
MSFLPRSDCVACGDEGAIERFSLGAYYSRLCDLCWEEAPVRKEGPEVFDPLDAGETLDAEDGEAW